jgi:hypothetical protein
MAVMLALIRRGYSALLSWDTLNFAPYLEPELEDFLRDAQRHITHGFESAKGALEIEEDAAIASILERDQ